MRPGLKGMLPEGSPIGLSEFRGPTPGRHVLVLSLPNAALSGWTPEQRPLAARGLHETMCKYINNKRAICRYKDTSMSIYVN